MTPKVLNSASVSANIGLVKNSGRPPGLRAAQLQKAPKGRGIAGLIIGMRASKQAWSHCFRNNPPKPLYTLALAPFKTFGVMLRITT